MITKTHSALQGLVSQGCLWIVQTFTRQQHGTPSCKRRAEHERTRNHDHNEQRAYHDSSPPRRRHRFPTGHTPIQHRWPQPNRRSGARTSSHTIRRWPTKSHPNQQTIPSNKRAMAKPSGDVPSPSTSTRPTTTKQRDVRLTHSVDAAMRPATTTRRDVRLARSQDHTLHRNDRDSKMARCATHALLRRTHLLSDNDNATRHAQCQTPRVMRLTFPTPTPNRLATAHTAQTRRRRQLQSPSEKSRGNIPQIEHPPPGKPRSPAAT